MELITEILLRRLSLQWLGYTLPAGEHSNKQKSEKEEGVRHVTEEQH